MDFNIHILFRQDKICHSQVRQTHIAYMHVKVVDQQVFSVGIFKPN